VCGTLNLGPAPKIAPATRLIWPVWGCSFFFGAIALLLILLGLLDPGAEENVAGWALYPAFMAIGGLVVAAVASWWMRRHD